MKIVLIKENGSSLSGNWVVLKREGVKFLLWFYIIRVILVIGGYFVKKILIMIVVKFFLVGLFVLV